jgi:hypothetical protein
VQQHFGIHYWVVEVEATYVQWREQEYHQVGLHETTQGCENMGV